MFVPVEEEKEKKAVNHRENQLNLRYGGRNKAAMVQKSKTQREACHHGRLLIPIAYPSCVLLHEFQS
jgi:hypothetical protein